MTAYQRQQQVKELIQICESNLSDENILKVFIGKNNNINSNFTGISWLSNHQQIYNYLLNRYQDSESIYETLYRLKNHIEIRPKCKTCGRPLKFTNGEFPNFCCAHCRNIDPDVLAKNKAAVSKAQKENYKRNGKEILAKRQDTLSKKYDTSILSSSPFAYKQVQEKAKNTIREHFGVENVFQLSENRTNQEFWQNRSIDLWRSRGYNISYLNDEFNSILVKNGCSIHGDIKVPYNLFNNRMKEERRDIQTLCPICNPINNSETSIETIIKNILDELNIQYIQHDRNQIHPLELDFYIPSFNIAIECNGIYWHQGIENALKHLQKYSACKNKNIRLIYLWEDQIINKSEIIKSYLMSIFQLNKKIYARKCTFEKISKLVFKAFLNNNYLDKFDKSADSFYGLTYNDNLVMVMSFKQNEIIQYCSLGDYTIVGGFSKLVYHYFRLHNLNNLFINCLNDVCNFDLECLGFTYIKEIEQNYFYVDKKLNRNNSKGFKCYNCGYKRYELVV